MLKKLNYRLQSQSMAAEAGTTKFMGTLVPMYTIYSTVNEKSPIFSMVWHNDLEDFFVNEVKDKGLYKDALKFVRDIVKPVLVHDAD